RVLAYPEFVLDAGQQAALVAHYRALSTLFQTGEPVTGLPHKGAPIHDGLKPVWSRMPRCSDPDDQKVVELAAASGAQALVSKDHAVLKLRRRCAPLFRVMTPVEAQGWLERALS
ncbi:MAG: PIN domain-containing protein, partial [Thiobacillus sp.]|nr:PIN domain-containing protein [Thiobacillus sp.]